MNNIDLWRQAAEDIAWYRAPTRILDGSNPPFYRWYPDGVTNACYNAFRQDTARYHAHHCRQRALGYAGYHRRSGDTG